MCMGCRAAGGRRLSVCPWNRSWVDGDGDGADADRAEEEGDPAGGVVAGEQDALLAADAEVEEGAGGAAGEEVEVAVGDVGGGGVDRGLGGPAGGEVAFDQVGGDVVPVGQLHHRQSWHGTRRTVKRVLGWRLETLGRALVN